MEVNNLGQGRQIALDLNTNLLENSGQSKPVADQISTKAGSEYTNLNEKKNVSEKDVEKAVDKLNKLLEDKATHAEYEVYGKSKDLIVRIVDNNTKRIVQELPPKQIIDMIDKFCELAGIFVDKKA